MTYQTYTLTSSGGTINFLGERGQYTPFRIYSAAPVTLAASFSIVDPYQLVGVPSIVRWETAVTLGAFSVTINGVAMSQDRVNQPGTFVSVWDGVAYSVQYFPDFSGKPQEDPGVDFVSVPATGSRTIKPGADKATIVLQGSPTTLTGNYTVSFETTGVTEGTIQRVIIGGDIDLSGNLLTVEGNVISLYDADKGNAMIYGLFGAGGWSTVYVNADVPVGKLDTAGYGSADDGKLVNYDDTTGKFEPSFIRAENFSGAIIPLYKTTVLIPSSEVLDLNSAPKLGLPAPGLGKAIEIIHCSAKITNVTTPYASFTGLRVRYVGANFAIRFQNDILLSTADRTLRMDGIVSTSSGTTNQQVRENVGIQIYVESGDPTAGDGDLAVNIWYTIVDY
jgi:hypothetical protein